MSTKLIKFYKGVCLVKIQEHLTKKQPFSIDELDQFLKVVVADIDKSCSDMTKEELQTLIEYSIAFANDIGLKLDYPKDELNDQIDLNFNR